MPITAYFQGYIIQNHDGRINQCDIVAATEWSKSTVSQTLTEMEEERLIHRVSIRLEKIVLLRTIAAELGVEVEA